MSSGLLEGLVIPGRRALSEPGLFMVILSSEPLPQQAESGAL